jgi:hypothetical protein
MKLKKLANQTKPNVAVHVATNVKLKKNNQKLIDVLLLILFLSLLSQLNLYSQGWVQKGSDLNAEGGDDSFGWAVALSADGNTLAAGGDYNNGNGTSSGHVRVFTWDGLTWIQKGTDIDGEAAYDHSGYSVSLSTDGNTLAIGANQNDGAGYGAGHVRVYIWNGVTWIQKGDDIDGEASNDFFGYSVSLSSDGNTLAVGAINNDGGAYNAGHVRVFSWNGSAWIQKGGDLDGETQNERFGNRVALSSDGNTLAVGIYQKSASGTYSGQVRVYMWNGSAWIQKGNNMDGEAAYDKFGRSISMSSDGNIVAIGGDSNSGSAPYAGHARVYVWNGTAWIQKGNDIDGETAYERSGWAVSISQDGNVLAVGAFHNAGNGENSGCVRVYNWDGSAWIQIGEDIVGLSEHDQFGNDVSLNSDGSILAAGAHQYGGGAGQVRVFSYISCNNTYSELDTTACFSYTSPSGNIWTESGTYEDIIPNAAGCDSIITINLIIGDDEDPVILAPASVTIECDASIDPANTGYAVATDNCDENPTITFTDHETAGNCTNEKTITRTWMVEDASGNTSTATQTINIVDDTPPVPPTAPADVTVQCADEVPAVSSLTAIDNCSGSITADPIDVVTPGACVNDFVLIRTWTFTDDCGNTSSVSQTITVNDNIAPVITGIPSESIVVENDPGQCGAVVDYPVIGATDNCISDVSLAVEPASGTFFQVGSTTVNVSATDACGNSTIESFEVIVTNNVPDIISISASLDPIPINTTIYITALSSDNNLESALWEWGDGLASDGIISTEILGEHSYSEPGVYTVILTLTDLCGESVSSVYQYIVVYDPEGGFVTGGGWINSPAGASIQYPDAVGKANFGFVSRYKKGATVPTGNTEFQFKAGYLNFNSYVYDWLVIAGSKAKFKGEGTINGTGTYGFMISAIDGDLKDEGEDKFRIKIWDKMNGDEIVYDNQIGDSDDADPTCELGGGSIVIHSGDDKKSTLEYEGSNESEVKVYPNPFNDFIQIDLISDRTDQINIELADMNGRVIEFMYNGIVEANINYHFEFNTNLDLNSGFYLVRIRNVDGEYISKEMILKQ